MDDEDENKSELPDQAMVPSSDEEEEEPSDTKGKKKATKRRAKSKAKVVGK